MDHSMMEHSKMDHSMPDMPMDDMCSMNMLLSWDYNNLCLLSSSWHIKTLPQFIVSLLLVAVLATGYEYLRVRVKRASRGITLDDDTNAEQVNGWSKSVFYGLLVGYSYAMMLIFMSYNGFVMASVVIGAIVGHHLFQGEQRDTLACH